ncbi:MAG: site-specific integrase [Anaerolineae bacterium]|nr:site-specific integrase [Anaerolineae bacterium]
MKLSNAFNAYLLDGTREKQWSSRHRDNIRQRLSPFVDQVADLSVASVTAVMISAHFNELDRTLHSAASWNSYRQTFRSFFKWCREQGYITRQPVTVPLRKHNKKNKTTSFEDFARLKSAATALLHSAEPTDVRTAAIWLFTADSACRLGEVASLTYDHACRQLASPTFSPGGLVYTFRIDGKTGEGWATVSELAAEAMRRWIDMRPSNAELGHDALWIGFQPNRLYRPMVADGGIKLVFEHVAELAGVTHNFRSHNLRYLNCKYYVERFGARIAQKKLRHSRVEFTLRVYHQVDELDVINATGEAGLLKIPTLTHNTG